MSANRLQPVLDPRLLAGELSNKMLINGAATPAISGRTFAVVNPATGEAIAEAAFGEAGDVDAAVGVGAEGAKSLGRARRRASAASSSPSADAS